MQSANVLLTRWDEQNLQTLIGSEADVRLLNQLTQKYIASDFYKWLTTKAEVKTSLNCPDQTILHLNAFDKNYVINGSATLTPIGLGDVYSKELQVNMVLTDPETTNNFKMWFDGVWKDQQNAVDIKSELLSKLNFVLETKSTLFTDALRPAEAAKIKCGKAHFKALDNEVEFTFSNEPDEFAGQYL